MKTILSFLSIILLCSTHLQAQTEDEQYELLKGNWKISYATDGDGGLIEIAQPADEVPSAFSEIKFTGKDKAILISATWSVKVKWHTHLKKIYFESKKPDVYRSYKLLSVSEEALQLQYPVKNGDDVVDFTVYYKKQ
jgi:hypothetical protein